MYFNLVLKLLVCGGECSKHLPQHVPGGVFVLPSSKSLFGTGQYHAVQRWMDRLTPELMDRMAWCSISAPGSLQERYLISATFMDITQDVEWLQRASVGIFKFVLSMPKEYPEVPPLLRFVTPVFHPLVSAQGNPWTSQEFHFSYSRSIAVGPGAVDVPRAFPHGWMAYRDQIWCVLTYAKKLFYHIETDNALNIEAASLYASLISLARDPLVSHFSFLISPRSDFWPILASSGNECRHAWRTPFATCT